jgi:hypothetical protein
MRIEAKIVSTDKDNPHEALNFLPVNVCLPSDFLNNYFISLNYMKLIS